MYKILALFAAPIVLLNIGSGVVGGVWLLFRGEWSLLIVGVLWGFLSQWLLSLLMLPGIGIGMLGIWLQDRKWAVYLFGYLSQCYTNGLILFTCFTAFFLCMRFAPEPVGVSTIPYLLWSWGMALGPWQFFASKERDNEFSALTLMVSSVLYFFFILSVFLPAIFRAIAFLVFSAGLLIVLPIAVLYIVRIPASRHEAA